MPLEGRIAIVTARWRGLRWTRQRQTMTYVRFCWRNAVSGEASGEAGRLRTAKSCGPGAATLALRRRASAGNGGKKGRFPGESTKQAVKTTRAGKAGIVRLNLW